MAKKKSDKKKEPDIVYPAIQATAKLKKLTATDDGAYAPVFDGLKLSPDQGADMLRWLAGGAILNIHIEEREPGLPFEEDEGQSSDPGLPGVL